MGAFADHIHELAYMVGAVRESGTASAGSATTLTDAVGLAGMADDDLNGLVVYIWDGAAQGQERRITDHAGATGIITFPTGTAPSTDSKYIIFQPHWRAQDLRIAIIMALRERRKYYMLPKVDESLTIDFDATPVYAYTVPTGFACIDRIVVERNAGESDFLDPIPPDCWYINRASTKQIVFEKEANDKLGFLKNGHKLRIFGQQYETEPTADTDSLTIPTGALLFLAASMAHNMARARDVSNARGHGQMASTYYQTWLNMRGDDEQLANPMTRWVNQN